MARAWSVQKCTDKARPIFTEDQYCVWRRTTSLEFQQSSPCSTHEGRCNGRRGHNAPRCRTLHTVSIQIVQRRSVCQASTAHLHSECAGKGHREGGPYRTGDHRVGTIEQACGTREHAPSGRQTGGLEPERTKAAGARTCEDCALILDVCLSKAVSTGALRPASRFANRARNLEIRALTFRRE